MTSRLLLFIALIFVVSFSVSRGDSVPTLPSRNPVIVLPLLKSFKPSDGYKRIKQILGKENVDTGNAINDCFYYLDDGTSVRVRAENDRVLSIQLQNLKKVDPIQNIYAVDKTWEH